jgi:hypothetical protein
MAAEISAGLDHLPATTTVELRPSDLMGQTNVRLGIDVLLCPFQESWGAPYLARFSRDVGCHSTPRASFRRSGKRLRFVVSHISRKTSEIWGTPRFVEGTK